MAAEILRLELIVLVDFCRSPHSRGTLSAEQCDSLCSMLTDVLAALYVEPECLTDDAIAEAQDRVLDELLTESEAGARTDRERIRDCAAAVPRAASRH
jgi:chromosome condensin MukBEF MukE localization factor